MKVQGFIRSDCTIHVYNREKACLQREEVFEEGFMRLVYGTFPGRLVARIFLSRKIFSRLYGWLQNRPSSRAKIRPFIESYGIDTSQLERPVESYESFNDFFKRRLRPEARPVRHEPDVLVSASDGRLEACRVDQDLVMSVKGSSFTLEELLGGSLPQGDWTDGTCVKIRLAPMDYHRFCYIDSGCHGRVVHVQGRLHSVSPLALMHNLKILQGNDREYVVLETANFGRVIHVDIGAMAVGRIHQHLREGGCFSRGQEKGYFEMGGSTIILIFEQGMVELDQDIMHYSSKGIETLVRYGSRIGKRRRA